jgi:hypothetical protein
MTAPAPAAGDAAAKHELKQAVNLERKAAKRRYKTSLHMTLAHGQVSDDDRIIVPEYMCNAGANTKFEADPSDVDLKGIITPEAYFNSITELNEALSHARYRPIDFFLAGSAGLLPFMLIGWGVRHRKLRTKHKKILIDFMQKFNDVHAVKGARSWHVCVCVRMCICVRRCVRACVRASERACVSVCVGVSVWVSVCRFASVYWVSVYRWVGSRAAVVDWECTPPRRSLPVNHHCLLPVLCSCARGRTADALEEKTCLSVGARAHPYATGWDRARSQCIVSASSDAAFSPTQ